MSKFIHLVTFIAENYTKDELEKSIQASELERTRQAKKLDLTLVKYDAVMTTALENKMISERLDDMFKTRVEV